MTAPSVAPGKPAPAIKPAGEPQPEEPVPSVPLGRLGNDSLENLRAAFSVPSVGGPEGKEKGKVKQAVDMGAEEVDTGHGHGPSDEVPFEDKPVESALSTSDYPAVPSPTTTTLPATHPAASSPTTTPPMARGLGFTGMPYPTYGVTPAVTVPPMATAVSEPVASSSIYTGVPQPMPLLGWLSQTPASCVNDRDTDAFPWGAWPRDAAVTRTGKQAGKALRSQKHHYARVMRQSVSGSLPL